MWRVSRHSERFMQVVPGPAPFKPRLPKTRRRQLPLLVLPEQQGRNVAAMVVITQRNLHTEGCPQKDGMRMQILEYSVRSVLWNWICSMPYVLLFNRCNGACSAHAVTSALASEAFLCYPTSRNMCGSKLAADVITADVLPPPAMAAPPSGRDYKHQPGAKSGHGSRNQRTQK